MWKCLTTQTTRFVEWTGNASSAIHMKLLCLYIKLCQHFHLHTDYKFTAAAAVRRHLTPNEGFVYFATNCLHRGVCVCVGWIEEVTAVATAVKKTISLLCSRLLTHEGASFDLTHFQQMSICFHFSSLHNHLWDELFSNCVLWLYF